jgi:NAD(P)H-dependent FMN reductase
MNLCKAMVRIGVLLGSTRPNGNILGLERWLNREMASAGITAAENFEVTQIFPNASMHPLGPIEDDVIPALVDVTKGASYTNEKVREWGALVASCDAFVILTPQHNWGYPGDLKTALDHLYHEWARKPVMVVTYGGHGGGKCFDQLKVVLSGLKMQVIDESIPISLPGEFIRTSARLLPDSFEAEAELPEFLKVAREPLLRGLEKLMIASVV